MTVHGADAKDMKIGYTPLDLCLFASRHKELPELLLAKGPDLNTQASRGATPLLFAVPRDRPDDGDRPDDVKFLIDKGANVNAADAYGDTILDAALRLQ